MGVDAEADYLPNCLISYSDNFVKFVKRHITKESAVN